MVVIVHSIMEWGVYVTGSKKVSPGPSDLVRCFGILGSWCDMAHALVPTSMAGNTPSRTDSNQRIDSYHPLMCPVGESLERNDKSSTLR